MRSKVNFMRRASMKIGPALQTQVARELELLFPAARAITVYECFHGYSCNQQEKVVLGVEARSGASHHTHIVKLGRSRAVSGDYEGWLKCFRGRPFPSRIFVPVTRTRLPHNRTAIIYEDAYQLYGDDTDAQPQSLETVVRWAIHDDKPDPVSVERVIRQIYTDMYRWFYRSPRADPRTAVRFYKRQLESALDHWTTKSSRVELRRDAIWLFCGQEPPAFHDGDYLDPYDFVCWALKPTRIPQTLIGNSHGDLHGRNVLVGIQRGEAEYPAIFDYGAMGDANVLVWDYVKLETELKVREWMRLYQDEDVRREVLSRSPRARRWKLLLPHEKAAIDVPMGALRAEQLAFAFEFEKLLAELTSRIDTTADAESPETLGGKPITGKKKLDRALGILLSIRQEAALWLGARQPQREQRSAWRDEYYFALAVYALSTAKWDYKCFETAFALVSGGVAVAQLRMVPEAISQLVDARPGSSQAVPLLPGSRVPRAAAVESQTDQGSPRSARAVQTQLRLFRAFPAGVRVDVGRDGTTPRSLGAAQAAPQSLRHVPRFRDALADRPGAEGSWRSGPGRPPRQF